MVFFICGGCGSCVKKPQVDKHIYQCRNSGILSCMDCNKDFHGNEYKDHTKCITELEKYSEVGFKPAANHNKGEKKQESWVEIVRATLNEKSTSMSPASRSLLHTLTKHDNVPRKRSKFMNFIKNVTRNAFDIATIENVWSLLEKQWEINKPKPVDQTNGSKTSQGNTSSETSVTAPDNGTSEERVGGVALNKREKKAERRNKQHKEEKKETRNDHLEANNENGQNGETEVGEDKSSKKKKRKRDEDETEVPNQEIHSQPKKKKKRNNDEEVTAMEIQVDNEADDSTTPAKKSKFNWEDIIKEILQKKPDNEISLKKLKKKAFAEYYAVIGDTKGEKSIDDLSTIMTKKIKKCREFMVLKDNVKLVPV